MGGCSGFSDDLGGTACLPLQRSDFGCPVVQVVELPISIETEKDWS
jgi:hypothetical protein